MKKIKFLLTLIFVLLAFVSCKKDKAEPEEQIDFTQYCIVEKAKPLSANDPLALYLLTFNADGECIIITVQGEYIYKYAYENGMLKIYSGTGAVRSEYKMENKTIVSSTGNDASFKPQLIKVPATNLLSGNSYYSGGWTAEGSLIIQTSNLKFTDTQFGETSFNEPIPNKLYILRENIAAKSSENGVMSFWILVNGKIEAQRINFNPTKKWYSGQFNKQ